MQVIVVVKNLTSGGAEKQSILLAKALAGLYNVHYIVLNAKYQEAKYLQLLNDVSNVQYVALEGGFVSRAVQFYSYIKKHKINIIFSYLTAANLYSIIAGRLAGCKFVYTGIRNTYLPPGKALVDRLLCNGLASKAVLNCYSGKDYFEKQGFHKDKMIVIPNCFENIVPYLAKEKTDEKIRIISVGRFVEQKDYSTALQAIKKLVENGIEVVYQIVGYGELESLIRDKIRALDLESIVCIYINPSNIPELLDNADIYLATSTFEGTSNSIMEAMNANLPIVATDVGDNSHLVKHKSNGYLTPIKDINAIASALAELVTDNHSRASMGENSKIRLLDNYSVDRFQRSYQMLIDSTK